MVISNSEHGARELLAGLTGDHSSLAITLLDEMDSRVPSRNEAEMLKQAYDTVKDTVLSFQIKKSLRLAVFKLKKATFKVSLAGLQKLLEDQSRLEDLALAIATIETAEAFLAADYLRQAHWQNFPAPILPSFCSFFKKHGGIEDSQALQELTRNPDPTVLTAALAALEKIDPGNLQGIIIPLLDSPQNMVKAQAIQAFYSWNKSEALKHLLKLLFSTNEQEIILALHHASFFPYPEIEPHLIRLLTQVESPSVLMRVSQILKNNANIDLPFRIFWVNRSLEGQHQSLVKGIILGIVRSLADKKLIEISVQDYLNALKERIKAEELRLLKVTCSVTSEEAEESILPGIFENDSPATSQPSTSEALTPAGANEKRIGEKPTSQTIKNPEVEFDNYASLSEQDKIQLLARGNASFFNNHRPRLLSLFAEAQGRELCSLINLFGKFGKSEDSEKLKKLCKSDNPDIVCACIRALSTLDAEFLCLYLPQFMQEKNGKIRMTATRIFVTIDRERIRSLISSLLASSHVKQRMLGVSSSMLVDFNIIREPLLDAMSKETNVEVVEKLGIVLASNPDRELLNSVYKISRTSRASLKAENQQIAIMLAENLSKALNHISTPEELLKEADNAFAAEQKILKAEQEKAKQNKEIGANAESIARENLDSQDDLTIQNILTSDSKDPKTKRAKATIIVWVLAAIVWGGSMAMLIAKYLFGE